MYGPCLSTIGGGQALTSPRRHSLGKLLPYQLADIPQALLQAACAFTPKGLFGIIPPFGGLCQTRREIPTCYYLVRHATPLNFRTLIAQYVSVVGQKR